MALPIRRMHVKTRDPCFSGQHGYGVKAIIDLKNSKRASHEIIVSSAID
jgi:hypothetical protein